MTSWRNILNLSKRLKIGTIDSTKFANANRMKKKSTLVKRYGDQSELDVIGNQR
ncbi:hypothetical protein Rcae01_01715 [Novipirellula caenicola]|uniref:Uncharacterized protein n=1 Tax=Novipirellula caenicola TaxID=1536901 RepID=A0ABP9VM35_9BACT